MNFKNAAYILSSFATLALLSGCGGNAFSPIGGQSSGGQPIPFVAQVPILLTTSNSVGNHSLNIQDVQSQALPPDAGTVYYAYIGNASTATANLTVTSYSVPESTGVGSPVWSTDPVIPISCKNMPPGDERCALPVAVNGNNIESSGQFTTIMTVNYSNGTSSQIPLAVNIIESSESGILASVPSPIVTNASGFATGVVTVYNAGSSAYSIDPSNIFPSPQQPGWTFTVNCNGVPGSNIIESNSSCTILYTYQAPSVTAPPPTSVALQWNNVTNPSAPAVNITTPSATVESAPVTPAPYLVYPSGSVVSVASGSGRILLQNIGNAPLASVIATVPPGLVADTSACNNLAIGATCYVVLTASNPESVPYASVLLTPSSGSPQPGITVAVAGQDLGITPYMLNFGTDVYGGAVITQQIIVTNLGQSPLSTLAVTPTSVDPAYVVNSSCSPSLAAFTSCIISVIYTAPNSVATQIGTVIVSAASESNVPATLYASSQQSTWLNMLLGATSPYIFNHVVPLINGNESYLFFGVSPTTLVAGPRNVWSILNTLPAGQPINLTESLAGWPDISTSLPSAPTALAYSESKMFVGTFYGDVKACSESCTSLVTGIGGVGVTSLVNIESNGFASFSDTSTNSVGYVDLIQNWATNSPNLVRVSGINASVGKMATDGINVYGPLGSGQLVVINSSGVVAASNIAPSSLITNEFPTVVYINGNSMWIGTSKGNVYMSTATPANTNSSTWTKLTATPLSAISYVSALGLTTSNNLYAGLATLNNPTTGGGMFVQNNQLGAFAPSDGYSDYSSVSAINIDNNGNVEASTYAGNIWQLQQIQR